MRKRLDEAERGNARLKARNRKLGKFGRKSERTQRSRKGGTEREARRRRGRQPGSPDVRRLAGRGRGHLGNAAACGKPYARNGEKVTEFVEVEVRAYKRRCRRPRYRSTCSCAPKREVVAPPVPRLFANTPYGLSVLVSDRDLRPSPSVAVGTATVVDARLRGRAGHAGGQHQALRSLVRTAGRCNCRASGSGQNSPRRRDELEGSRPRRGRRESPQLALGLPDPGCCKGDRRPFPQRSGGAEVVRGSWHRRASISRSAYKKLARELPNHFVLAYCWGAARLHQHRTRTPRHEAFRRLVGKPNRGRSQRQATAAFHGERTNRCTRRNRSSRTILRHSSGKRGSKSPPWRKTRRSASRCSPCCVTARVWR